MKHWSEAVPTILSIFLLIVVSVSAWASVPLVPPPETAVTPEIEHPAELDANGDRIDDTLEGRLAEIRSALSVERNPSKRAALEQQLDEPVRVQLVFSRQITQKQIDAFQALGGRIDYIYQTVSYGWNATLPLRLVEALPSRMGTSLVAVVGEMPIELHMDEATQTGRVRGVWQPGFAGSASGYSGSSTTTIAIIDSGVDDSHTDLAGRLEYWMDYTTDGEPTPRDIIQHGTHVAGIAFGTGAAQAGNPSQLYYTDSGNLYGVPSGSGYLSPIHLSVSGTVSSTAQWVGGGSATLYWAYRSNGSTGSVYTLTSNSGSSPVSLSYSNTAMSSRQYMAFFPQSGSIGRYAVQNTVPYQAIGDGLNTFGGVAPGCRWAAAKTFTNSGSGNNLDLGEAVDDMVTQRTAHNIKVINMSVGTIGDPGLDTTLRNKVNTAVNNGVLVVVSAGNDGPGTSGSNQVDDPGRAALALTVAAGNDINQLTQYTSSGFSSPTSSEDYKPDVMAPGGSYFYSAIMAPDSNDADAQSTTFADARANDYYNIAGTSMASPFTAGASALVIQALEESGTTWDFYSAAHPLLVKMLLCATCTESNAPREVSSGTNPTLGRATTPKDLYEGYGLINPDAAIEAITTSYSGGSVGDSTAGGYFDRRAWGMNVALVSGTQLNLHLDVPTAGDFDIYLYSGAPNSKGNPVILAAGATAGLGVDEAISYTPSVTETGYLVVKRVSGNGAWTLSGVGPQPPAAQNQSVTGEMNTPATITLGASDDGLPVPPGQLSYIITSLPTHGSLADPGAGAVTSTPYTLANGGNQVVYTPATGYLGADSFQFKANDGGAPPNGGDSNTATVSITVLPSPVEIHEAKMLPNDSPVNLVAKTVSAAFSDYFYIQSDDRSSGIRVNEPSHGLTAGVRADIVGRVKVSTDGERYIDADTAAENGTGIAVPLGIRTRVIGGCNWPDNDSVAAGIGQEGIQGVTSGLNNIGLLVRTWGEVTYAGTDHFYLDDGCSVSDGSGHIGVKVEASGLAVPTEGQFIPVTGISSCFRAGDGLQRLIRVRGQGDIGGKLRLLSGTGSGGLNVYCLVELQTDPVAEVLIGPASYNTGLDFSPDGVLYGASSSLRIIDPETGGYTTVGTIHSSTESSILMRSIAFHPNGTLYGLSSSTKVLYTIDTSDAFATAVVTVTGYPWGIDFAPDGTLYGAMTSLMTIDLATGATSTIGSLGATVLDIDFAEDGSIYAVHDSSMKLYKIDPSTAGIMELGTYDSSLWSVASQTGAGASSTVELQGERTPADREQILRDEKAIKADLESSLKSTSRRR